MMNYFNNSNAASDTADKKMNIKKNKLIKFPIITVPLPFNHNLSFLQKDRYIYELGYLLKTKYPELEAQWRDLKNISDCSSNKELCEGFEEIDVNFIKSTLTLDLHFKAANILSEVFDKLIDFVNHQKNDDYLDERIKILTNEFYIYQKTQHIFKKKFLVDLDYSSYVYDERTKLYAFNQTKSETIDSLKKYISVFKTEIESVYDYFDHPINIKIMDSILINMESSAVLVAILDMIKEKINFSFNNENKFEIAYQDKVLNLKSGAVVERTHKHHFTTSVNARYLKKYTRIPEYIKSVFGTEKEELKEVQKLLGSLLTGCVQDKFILFYGDDPNSKRKLLNNLEEILNGFYLNLNHEERDAEKQNFKEKRVVTLDIECRALLKDEMIFKTMVSNRSFNLIVSINGIPMERWLYLQNLGLTGLKFSLSLSKQVDKDVDINNDFFFTWLVKGAFEFLNSKAENQKVSNVQFEAMKTYDSDDGFSSEDEELF